MQIVGLDAEAESFAEPLDVLERVDPWREDEEDGRLVVRFLVSLGELDAPSFCVFRTEFLLNEDSHSIYHPVWPERAHHAQFL